MDVTGNDYLLAGWNDVEHTQVGVTEKRIPMQRVDFSDGCCNLTERIRR